MDDVEAAARAIRRKAREDLRSTVERLRFEGRERVVCVVCGAELQVGRCPWSKVGAAPSADGNTYCGWSRTVRGPGPAYHYNRRR